MKKHWVGLILFAALAAATVAGGLEWFEHALMDFRFRLVQRDAGDRLVLVEIDQRSLRALDVWPWPRFYHAELVDRLVAAGADTVALDIDFSSRSSPAADAAFEQALARAGRRVVLPVFEQRSARAADALTGTRPLDVFARHASLASVVVQPGSDGRVRRIAAVDRLDAEAVPSLATVLGANGRPAPADFYIDFGIRPRSFARVSYVDVLRGEFPPDLFKGRGVLVGATAVELGDQFSVPAHVIVPGTVVQALAAESLRQGRALARTGTLPALAGALALMLLLPGRIKSWPWTRGLAAASGTAFALLGGSVALQAAAPVSLDLAPVLVASFLCFAHGVLAKVQWQNVHIFRQRMAVQQINTITHQIVDNSFDAIVVVGRDGNVVLHNRAAERLFGRDGRPLLGRHMASLLRNSSEEGHARSVAELMNDDGGGAHLIEGFAVDGLGAEVPVELSIRRAVIHPTDSPFERRTRPRTFHFITARDISGRVRAEKARTAALHEAEAASRAKSQFLAAVSHELRTPLNAIIGFSEMIQGQVFGPVGDARYTGYIGDIHASGQHLLGIVNDILDVTRVEAGEMKMSEGRVDLAACIDSALRLLAGQLAKKPVAIALSVAAELPPLLADERFVKQILINLLSNAIKFTPQDGSITVAAVLSADGGIALGVADTGIGIAEEQIAMLGRPFFQVDQSDTRQFEGLGLGLSIVRGLMQLHGGTVEIESRLGEGAVVTCLFPPARTGAGAQAAA